MSSLPSLNAEVIKVEERAKYRGTVYTQGVLIKFDNTEFWLFDEDLAAEEDDIGSGRDLKIGLLAFEIDKGELSEYGFKKLEDVDDESVKVEVKGKVIDEKECDKKDNSDFIIKVGGDQTVKATTNSNKLEEGEEVTIKARLDLLEVRR